MTLKLKETKKYFGIFAAIFLLAWLSFFICEKIDLTTSDLGRHLKNGELIFKGSFDVLKTNFYSFTYPDFPFLNHHWGGGALFYLFQKIGGFLATHLFYVVLTLITFLLFFRLATKQSDVKIAALLSLILIPLIAQRKEVRPEVFSYFFSGLFFLILTFHKKGFLSGKWLLLLPFLQIIWVQTHIYFILGPVIIGAFLLEKIVRRNKATPQTLKSLIVVLAFALLAVLVNPFGASALSYSFKIFGNYGYQIVDNQSVWFLEGLGFIKNPNFVLLKLIFGLLFLSFVLVFIKKRKEFSLACFCLGMGFGAAAFLAIRNFTLFGFFALPILAQNIKILLPQEIEIREFLIFGLVVFVLVFSFYAGYLPLANGKFGLGLLSQNNGSAEFFKTQQLQGPVFNNYDIGAYLIYYLYPQEKVFVDNRPETYPASFFKETYIPMQEDEKVWQREEQNYKFNAIFFSYRDLTPWAQKFLIARVEDSVWAPVFADQYSIIFLKRNDLNQKIIAKYEIPRENFSIIQ